MLGIYKILLHLYPAAYREQFGMEMAMVLEETTAAAVKDDFLARGIVCMREVAGLLIGASREHMRAFTAGHVWLPFSVRRFAMRNEFRFPKLTPVLMMIILAGVVLAIDKGEAIQASLPHVNPQIGPIQPVQHAFLPAVALFFAFFYAVGLIGWAILFALRRSGVHRLADMSSESK
jgi:hypothetical protein